MTKTYQKIFLLTIVSFLIIPQVTLAAWWNPFSWSWFNKSPKTETTSLTDTTKNKNQIKNGGIKNDTQTTVNNNGVGNEDYNRSNKPISIKFDTAVMKSSLMIQIFDNSENRVISWGSGVSVGGFGNILTNHHVVEDIIKDPTRYKAYGCITISLNTEPECDYLLSITRKTLNGKNINAQYDSNLDLALLYVDQIKVNGNWVSIINVPFDKLKDRSINLSAYTKNYNDLQIGDSVYSIGYPDYGGGKTIQVEGVVTSGPETIIVQSSTGEKGKRFVIGSNFGISHGNSGGPVFNSKGELIGMTDACQEDQNKKCVKGYFLPLPTVNSWYTKVSDSHLVTWQGKNYYSSNNGISDNTQKASLCLLEGNAHYDSQISTNNCTCNAGYYKNTNGQCVNSVGVVDPPKTPYGKTRDPEAEKKALQALDSLFSDINQGSTQTPPPNTNQVELYINNNFNPATKKANEGVEYTNKGLILAGNGLRVDAEKYLNYSIESFNNAASTLGENPPANWIKTHNCLVSFLINSVTASTYLKSSFYYSGTDKAMEYITTAQTFTNKAKQDQACVSNTRPI